VDRLEVFLSTLHNVSLERKKYYRYAVCAFEKESGLRFEDVFNDVDKVHVGLAALDGVVNDSTWNAILSVLKKYAAWLNDPVELERPRFWKNIREKKIDWDERLKGKHLSEGEFWQILNAVDHPRDKAMLCVGVAGGLRPGELLGLRVGDVKASSAGFMVTVSGKTGTRTFAMSLFAPALLLWLQHHPKRDDFDAPLWVRLKAGVKGLWEPLGYDGADRNFKRFARRAGVAKKVSLHWLRHTKVTWTFRRKDVRVSDDMARKMFGWTKNSSMPARYSHLTGADTVDAFLALDGVKEVTRKIEEPSCLAPKKCLGCGEVNIFDALFCRKCGLPLSVEEAERILERNRKIEKVAELLEDLDLEELLKRKK